MTPTQATNEPRKSQVAVFARAATPDVAADSVMVMVRALSLVGGSNLAVPASRCTGTIRPGFAGTPRSTGAPARRAA
ncbi:hypothetical protein GCM10009788_27550 [Nocardioides humi]|uniref:Uncharacterized protein n=1 Tax=Nocardioides humi TaxID=449461 RepID=A0ABN2AN53_9ACTN